MLGFLCAGLKVIVAASLALLCLTGCSSGGQSSSTGSAVSQKPEAVQNEVTITDYSEGETVQQFLKEASEINDMFDYVVEGNSKEVARIYDEALPACEALIDMDESEIPSECKRGHGYLVEAAVDMREAANQFFLASISDDQTKQTELLNKGLSAAVEAGDHFNDADIAFQDVTRQILTDD